MNPLALEEFLSLCNPGAYGTIQEHGKNYLYCHQYGRTYARHGHEIIHIETQTAFLLSVYGWALCGFGNTPEEAVRNWQMGGIK